MAAAGIYIKELQNLFVSLLTVSCCCCHTLVQVAGAPSFMGQPVIPRPQAASAPGLAPQHHRPARQSHRPRAAARSAVVVEANLFSRLVRVVKAYVTNFTEGFEDPEVLLDRVTDEMQEDLIKMRQATAKVSCVLAEPCTGKPFTVTEVEVLPTHPLPGAATHLQTCATGLRAVLT